MAHIRTLIEIHSPALPSAPLFMDMRSILFGETMVSIVE